MGESAAAEPLEGAANRQVLDPARHIGYIEVVPPNRRERSFRFPTIAPVSRGVREWLDVCDAAMPLVDEAAVPVEIRVGRLGAFEQAEDQL